MRIQISAGDQAAKGSWLSVKRKRKRWLHKYAHLPPAAAASAVPARLSLRPSVRLCVRPAPGEAEMRRDGSAGLHEGGSGLSAQRRCRSPPSRYAGTPLPGCNARAALRGKRGKSGAERQRCRERPGYGSGRGTGEPSSRNNNTAAPQNVEIHGEPWRWEWRESRSSSGQSYHKHIVYLLPSALCCFLHAKHYHRILQIEMCKKRSRAWGEGGGWDLYSSYSSQKCQFLHQRLWPRCRSLSQSSDPRPNSHLRAASHVHARGEVLSWKKQMILQAKTNIEPLPMHMHYTLSCTEAEQQCVPGKQLRTAHPGRAGGRQAKAHRVSPHFVLQQHEWRRTWML